MLRESWSLWCMYIQVAGRDQVLAVEALESAVEVNLVPCSPYYIMMYILTPKRFSRFNVPLHSFIFVERHHWLYGCCTFICSSDPSHNYCYHRVTHSQCWHFPWTDSSYCHWFYPLRFWSSADFDSLATLQFAVVSMCILLVVRDQEEIFPWEAQVLKKLLT